MDKLFDRDRFPDGIKLIPLLLYLPAGVLLAFLRFFMSIQTLIAARLLQKISAVRLAVLRALCCTLGLVVREENASARDKAVPLIVSNHISIADHIAIHLATGSIGLTPQNAPVFVQRAFFCKGSEKIRFAPSELVDIQPESVISNGRYGVLKFKTVSSTMHRAVQPISLRIWRPPITDVSPNILGATWLADLLWFLIVPITVVTIKYLPAIKKLEDETDEEWTRRMEKAIADDLHLKVTDAPASVRADLERQLLPLDVQLRLLGPAQMAVRLKETFPNVSVELIKTEIERTKNMRLAIANLIRISKDGGSSSSSSVMDPTLPECAGFPKSAQERMATFQERKARLLENARKRYIEKKTLDVASS